MDSETEERRQKELRERENQRRIDKDRKKRKKKERKRNVKEIKAAVDACYRVMDRVKRVDDMNLRCYMMLDKFALMMDMAMAALTIGDIPDEARDVLNHQMENIQEEINAIMDWVIAERHVPNEELANPIPENGPNNNSSDRSDRRRRRDQPHE